MIVLFMNGEGLATIGNWVVLPIFLFWGKHCSQSLSRSICFKQELLGVVSEGEDRGTHAGLLQSLEGS